MPKKPVSKSELARRVAKETGLTMKVAKVVVNAFLENVKRALIEDGYMRVFEFGSFQTKVRSERYGYIPSLGLMQLIPEKKVVRFKQSTSFVLPKPVTKGTPTKFHWVHGSWVVSRNPKGDIPDILPNDIHKRTIEKVLQLTSEGYKPIKVSDLFLQMEKSEMGFDSAFAKCCREIESNIDLFLCPECYQPLMLKTKDAGVMYKAHFFTHLKGSEKCILKQDTFKENKNDSYLNRVSDAKYKAIKESISKALQTTPKVSDVRRDQKAKIYLPYGTKRKPDYQFLYGENEIAMEIIMNPSSLQKVIDRDNFYRLFEKYPLWVFASEGDDCFEYLGLQMAQNVYYANKRNVFLFDSEAQRKTDETGVLHMKCNWLDADNTWHFSSRKGNGNGRLVKLSELTFDEGFKVFFFDADEEYLKMNRNIEVARKRIDALRINRYKGQSGVTVGEKSSVGKTVVGGKTVARKLSKNAYYTRSTEQTERPIRPEERRSYMELQEALRKKAEKKSEEKKKPKKKSANVQPQKPEPKRIDPKEFLAQYFDRLQDILNRSFCKIFDEEMIQHHCRILKTGQQMEAWREMVRIHNEEVRNSPAVSRRKKK